MGKEVIHNEIREVPGFTGREHLFVAIEAALWGNHRSSAALTNSGTAAEPRSGAPATAVRGLGGVGKSAVAKQFAWLHQRRYRGVWWVRAETEQTLVDDLIELGSRLIANVKEIAEREQAVHWMKSQRPARISPG